MNHTQELKKLILEEMRKGPATVRDVYTIMATKGYGREEVISQMRKMSGRELVCTHEVNTAQGGVRVWKAKSW